MAANNDMLNRAWVFATEMHWGQLYGKKPYIVHLREVYNIVIQHTRDVDTLVSAVLHDVIEDTDATFNAIAEGFGYNVATLVYAVTDEEGKDREERKRLTYPKYLCHPEAIKVKLADRIANVESCIESGNEYLFEMYKKENEEFKKLHLATSDCDRMWTRLQTALSKKI